MYSQAAQKIQTQFQDLDVQSMTDSQIVKFFQVVDLALPKESDSEGFSNNCKIFMDVFNEYKLRYQRLFDQVNYKVDDFYSHQLNNLPAQFKSMGLQRTLAKPTEVLIENFDSKIVRLIKTNNLIAIASKDNIRVFNSSGLHVHHFAEQDCDKLVFDLTEKKLAVMFQQGNKIVYSLTNMSNENCERTVPFCPDYIKYVTDDIIQFYYQNRVGNFIFTGDKCEVHYFNLDNLQCELPNPIEDCEFPNISYRVNDTKLMAKITDFNYTLVNKAKDSCHNDLELMNSIKNSDIFQNLSPILRAHFVDQMRSTWIKTGNNDQFFK